MYHILIFYKIVFSILLSKINSKIINYIMVMLTEREMNNMIDTDVAVN
jgi:hypothetical protein